MAENQQQFQQLKYKTEQSFTTIQAETLLQVCHSAACWQWPIWVSVIATWHIPLLRHTTYYCLSLNYVMYIFVT